MPTHSPVSQPHEAGIVIVLEGETGPLELTLRSLLSDSDFARCEQLERDTWGQEYTVPASLLRVVQKVGGVAAGAFDSRGEMLGLVFGLAGWWRQQRVHWSHMLAVRESLRGLGLGRELKYFQRRLVEGQGVDTMLWTYDPLVARNAHLNINRLGARPVEYLRNVYGSESNSDLHRGLGTDRFVVEWRLNESAGVVRDDPVWDSVPIVNTDDSGAPLSGDLQAPTGDRLRVEVPFDIQLAKHEAADAGARWRSCTRQALEMSLGSGFAVVGFARRSDDDRCFYLLRRGESA